MVTVEGEAALLKQAVSERSVRLTDRFPPEKSGEVIVPIIESILCDIVREVSVNIVNNALVAGIPEDFAVEVPASVSRRGVQASRRQRLPDSVLAYILRDRVAPVNVELEAYARGDRQLLLQLIMMDPWTRSENQARSFLQEILALPYHEVMRSHYR